MSKLDLIATATFGLESVVAEEVRKLGYDDVRVENARVEFSADELAICRSNLWLRVADRVRLKVGEFTATTFDELFERRKPYPGQIYCRRMRSFQWRANRSNRPFSACPTVKQL